MSKANKVHVTARLHPNLVDALKKHCVANSLSRSEVIDRGIRFVVFPEYIDERERIITENLDRLYWEQRRQGQIMRQQFQILKEMMALYIRQFYMYTPPLPESEKKIAVVNGRERYERFLNQVAENVGTGPSLLEQAPVLALVEPEDFVRQTKEHADDDSE